MNNAYFASSPSVPKVMFPRLVLVLVPCVDEERDHDQDKKEEL